MGRTKTVRLSVLLILLTIAPLAFGASEQQHWLQVHSDHFSILTDNDVKHGRAAIYQFEQMRYVFGATMNRPAVHMPVPLQIIGFRSRNELMQYAPLYQGKPVDMAGFFEGSPDADFIALDLSGDDLSTALHEYIHVLVQANFPPVPAWFDEGLAEYFATMKNTPQGLEIGNVSETNRLTLSNMPWMKVEELLLVQTDSDIYNQRRRRAIFYAESWLLVHYLLSHNQLPQLLSYLQLTQIKQVPVPDAVQQAFGMAPDALEKALHDYFKPPMDVQRIQPLVIDVNLIPFERVDLATANAEVADLHAHSRDYRQQALGELQEALKSAPGNLVANRALAYIYIENKDFDNAAECLRNALATAPKDAQSHYLAALLIKSRFEALGQIPQSSVPMERELQAAISAYPEYAAAYNLLAYAYALEQRYPQAISNAQKAVQLHPGEEHYALDLAQYYASSGDVDKSLAVLARVKNSPDPDMVALADKKLQDIQAKRSQYLQQKHADSLMTGQYKQPATAPQWQADSGVKVATLDDLTAAANQEQQNETVRPTKYLYAELLSVNCSSPPEAIFSLSAQGKRLRMIAPDSKNIIVIGGDEQFSCDWRNRRVLVNYKLGGGKGDGEIVTVELK